MHLSSALSHICLYLCTQVSHVEVLWLNHLEIVCTASFCCQLGKYTEVQVPFRRATLQTEAERGRKTIFKNPKQLRLYHSLAHAVRVGIIRLNCIINLFTAALHELGAFSFYRILIAIGFNKQKIRNGSRLH